MKDLFSGHAADYAQYRPGYPVALFEWLASGLSAKGTAWDCGSGNGQVAAILSRFFESVEATDISREQLAQAPQLPNIKYSTQPAEHTHFASDSFDLVTVAQAIHWFDLPAFYTEVKRVSKPGAQLLVLGYGLIEVSPAVDPIVQHLYKEVLGPFWAHERKLIDEGYQTIPFPFEEQELPHFPNQYRWTLPHLLDYLRTWSAVKAYEKTNNQDPVGLLEAEFIHAWGAEAEKIISFPLIGRLGIVS